MGEPSTGDSSVSAGDIEMKLKSPDEKDNETVSSGDSKVTSASDEKPPKPPKRDYAVEKAETHQQSPTESVEYASVNKRKKLVSFPPRPEFVYKPESSEAYMTCLKHCLVVINLLIWLLGAVITALGIWIKVDKEFWNIQTNLNVTQFNTASWVLIAAGIIIMLVGFLGCYGAMASRICMLIVFSIIVIIVLLLEIAVMAIVWSAVSNKNVQEEVKLRAKTAMQRMTNDENKRYFIDLLQAKLQCCGVDGPSDYALNPKDPKPIPPSCTNKDTGVPNTRGCYEAVVEFLKNKAAIVGGVALAILLLQVCVLVFTTCLICSIKNAATNSIF
ncbi:CD9 antigen [Nephila pilipes]|uniref:CD9 antigen n=1 Tax=Nephila pilipes TaxID=299642 RepID=A0A8X6IQI9_NEPPI|nr:CD9 antigen [Nephila pilipes]